MLQQSRFIFTLNLPSVTVSLTGNHRDVKTSILHIRDIIAGASRGQHTHYLGPNA